MPATVAGVPGEIVIPGDQVFPESLTSTHDGTVIIGSVGTRQILRVKPGAARAEPWILPGTEGLKGVLGVFADEASNTLYACSNDLVAGGTSPAPAMDGTLYVFDLTTGAPEGHHPLPTPGAQCNDIAVGADGSVYATDTANGEVIRLQKGAPAMEVWASVGAKGALVDGIAVVGNRVVVSTLSSNQMFSIPIQPDGSAGAVTEVKLDRKIARPDGIRSFGPDSLLMVESGSTNPVRTLLARLRGGPGILSKVTLTGNTGKVTTLKQGYPDIPVSVTVVGRSAYVLEGQLDSYFKSTSHSPKAVHPFHATAFEVGTLEEAGKL